MPDLIGTLATRPDRSERMAVYAPDGRILATFAAADTREDIRAKLRAGCLVLADDGQVFEL